MKQPITEADKIKVFTLPPEEKERLVKTIREILAGERRIILAFLYGSFLEEGPFRDIDIGILVEKDPPPPTFYEIQLESEISKALSTDIPIDVRIVNDAPVTFLYHVIKGRPLVCRDPNFFSDYITLILRKYLDLKPILEHYTKETYSDPTK